jgi:ribulose-phosphate 3-epimerase
LILAPSILAADFSRLGEEIAAAQRGGAAVVHVDVMDGRFVPNITVGPPVIRALARVSEVPLDVHLMIEDADRHLDAFVDAGAGWISVHVEAVPHLQRAIAHLRERGVEPGVAINPATPLSTLEEILPELHHVLVMSVNPGFGGQVFLPGSIDKIRRLSETIAARGLETLIEVDGGVGLENARELVAAGAQVLVAGTAVFAGGGAEEAARRLIEAAA